MRGWPSLLTFVAVAGCSGGAREPTPAHEPPAALPGDAPTALPPVTARPETVVRLVSAGAEPRRPLRYQPAPGTRSELAFNMDIAIAMSSGGHRMFHNQAVVSIKLTLEVVGVAGNGDIELEFTILEMTGEEFGPPGVATPPPAVIGKRGRLVLSDRGILVSTDIPWAEEHEEVRDALAFEDYLLALPEEAVGPGAVWQTSSYNIRNGISMANVETHELVELAGDSAKTVARFEQRAAPQFVPALRSDETTRFELVSFESDGSSRNEFSRVRALPRKGSAEFQFEALMRMSRPEGVQDVVTTMVAKLRSEQT